MTTSRLSISELVCRLEGLPVHRSSQLRHSLLMNVYCVLAYPMKPITDHREAPILLIGW